MTDDSGLERLLDLDGLLAEVGGGFWVKIVAKRVPPDRARPHGIAYALTLHDPTGERIFGIDNASIVDTEYALTSWVVERQCICNSMRSRSVRWHALRHDLYPETTANLGQ